MPRKATPSVPCACDLSLTRGAQAFVPLEATGLSEKTLERYQRAGLCVVAESIEHTRPIIDSGAYLLGVSSTQSRLRLTPAKLGASLRRVVAGANPVR